MSSVTPTSSSGKKPIIPKTITTMKDKSTSNNSTCTSSCNNSNNSSNSYNRNSEYSYSNHNNNSGSSSRRRRQQQNFVSANASSNIFCKVSLRSRTRIRFLFSLGLLCTIWIVIFLETLVHTTLLQLESMKDTARLHQSTGNAASSISSSSISSSSISLLQQQQLQGSQPLALPLVITQDNLVAAVDTIPVALTTPVVNQTISSPTTTTTTTRITTNHSSESEESVVVVVERMEKEIETPSVTTKMEEAGIRSVPTLPEMTETTTKSVQSQIMHPVETNVMSLVLHEHPIIGSYSSLSSTNVTITTSTTNETMNAATTTSQLLEQQQQAAQAGVVEIQSTLPLPHIPAEGNLNYTMEVIQMIQSTTDPNKRVLMYSPYDFSVGGGEKYFLEVVSYFLNQKYHVTILTSPTNFCHDQACLRQTAARLDIHLGSITTNQLYYFRMPDESVQTIIQKQNELSFVWYYEMGNSKFPQFHAPEHAFSIYQCQFPFDPENTGTVHQIESLSTFDVVVVNSEYTKMTYLDVTNDIFQNYIRIGKKFPTIETLNPPVSLLSEQFDETRTTFDVQKINIVMLGRIFHGRQSKGHQTAIDAIRTLNQKYEGKGVFHLHIIGQIQPGFDNHALHIKELAKDLPVTFHFSVSREELMKVLKESHFYWHLTGIESNGLDPASNEHFGISPVEAMSLGLIPIYYGIGGVSESARKCGTAIYTSDELIERTFALKDLTQSQYNAQSKTCFTASQRFGVHGFHKKLDRLFYRSKRTKQFLSSLPQLPHVNDIWEPTKNNQITTTTTMTSPYTHTAYIYVHGPSHQLPMIIKNVMGSLGPDWELVVGVRRSMKKYIEPFFAFMGGGVRFHVHNELDGGTVKDYSRMMMSADFWKIFNTEYILIFQPDSVMFYNNMQHFVDLELPLIGAPWCSENEVLSQHAVNWRVGNGGFSLRRKSWMIQCVTSKKVQKRYKATKSHFRHLLPALASDNEDIYFNICMDTLYSKEGIDEIEKAADQFAVEVPCGESSSDKNNINNNNAVGGSPENFPMAGHAFWYYTNDEHGQKYIDYGQQWMNKNPVSQLLLPSSSEQLISYLDEEQEQA